MRKLHRKKGQLTRKAFSTNDYKVICLNTKTNQFWVEVELSSLQDAKVFIDNNTLLNVEYYVLFKENNRILYKKEG
tara:strand:+ start:174 stop:401 length:228 start_codon:yes stop_codon:yes gene_type:complete